MQNAAALIAEIQAHGLENACDDTYIVPTSFPVGQYLPQGDINLLRLESVPPEAVLVALVAQLAPGTTRGSRHCISPTDLEYCQMYGFSDANPLEGPVIVFDRPITIEHPEHSNLVLPAGVWAIGYQRRFADELLRSQD